MLIVFADGWTFSHIGWLDPWYYVGYAYHYGDPSYQNGYYKVSRLPWILYQAAFRNVFEPKLASYLIQLTCLASAGLSVFATCRLLKLGDVAAFVASVFLITYAWFIGDGSGGADYQNTIAAPLYALTFCATTWAAETASTGFAIWTVGVLYALTVHSSIFYLNFFPVLLFHFVALQRGKAPITQSIKSYVVGLIGGGAVATLALCVVNRAVGRGFWFFKPILTTLWAFTTDNKSIAVWWKPWGSGWLWEARYMALLIGGVVVAAVGLYSVRRLSIRKGLTVSFVAARALFAEYLFLMALWIFWQSVGKTTLDYSYFAHLLIVPAVFVIAGLVSLVQIPKLTPAGAIVVCLVFLGSLLVAADVQRALPNYVLRNAMLVSLLLALLAAATLPLALRQGPTLLIPLCILALAKEVSNLHVLDFQPSSNLEADNAFLAVLDAHKILTEKVKGDQIYIWFDDQVPEFYMSDQNYPRDRQTRSFASAVVSTGLQYLDTPWDGMKDVEQLPEANLRQALQNNAYIALFTEHRAKVERLLDRVHRMGIHAKLEGPTVVSRGRVHVTIYSLKPT